MSLPYGSFMILNASAAKGSSSTPCAISGLSFLLASRPLTGGMSSGDGR